MIKDEWDQADNDREAEKLEKDEKIYLSAPYADLLINCPECGAFDKRRKTTPDVIIGHLAEDHAYRTEDVWRWLKDWMNSFKHDENGWPLEECPSHGLYKVPGPCYGCEAAEPRDD